MGLTMNVSQAMISSKDTQSALEAIWNKIDEKKQNPISLRLQPLKKRWIRRVAAIIIVESFYWIFISIYYTHLTILVYNKLIDEDVEGWSKQTTLISPNYYIIRWQFCFTSA
jgi:hypothetical protein